MGRALQAVRSVEEDYIDIVGAVQEGATVSNDAWNVVHIRYERARRKLSECRRKMAAGDTAADRSC